MVKQRMDLLELLRKRGMDGDVDLLREALRVLVDGIMDAEVSAQIGAQRGERSPERVTLPQRLPQPHLGHPVGHHRAQYQWSCTFPRCGKAATSPACWNRGGAARRLCWPSSSKPMWRECPPPRVDDLIKALGCDGISSSQVSRICVQLDEVVESFLGRPLDGGPYPYVWLDGLTQKVREGGRIVNVCVVVATGVNADGQREVLGLDVGASEDGAFWLAFLRSLTARGPQRGGAGNLRCPPGAEERHRRGVCWSQLAALPHSLHGQPADPSAQACPTRRGYPGPSHMVRTIYQQLSPAEVHGQLDRVVEQLREPFPQVAELLADAAPDILAFTAFPVAHWQKLWSNNPQERLNREIRRRRACPRKGTWWASSLTGCRHGGWWARCWRSSMTNGPKPAATSPSPTPSATRHCRSPIC